MKPTILSLFPALLPLFFGCGQSQDSGEEEVLSSSSLSGSSGALSSQAVSSSSEAGIPAALRITGLEASDLAYTWTTFNDNSDGGLSQASFQEVGEAYEGAKALQLVAALSQGTLPYNPNAGIALHLNGDGSSRAGIAYYYKGAAHLLRVEIAEVEDYCFHYISVPASANWTRQVIAWEDLIQEGWGKTVAFSPQNIAALSWNIKGADQLQDTLWLDGISYADSTMFPAVVPDFAIRPAGGPDTVIVGDIGISHPLQAKAMQYLTHGINLTNWLEENSKFSAFEYDEATVQKLAGLGFRGLRLPIDLDQYIVDKTNALAGSDPFVLDSSLFTVLDSFEVWTRRHGMSLTIDYHQYDGSFTVAASTTPRFRQMMKFLWASVSVHYAQNTREDLFYELLNEPIDKINATVWHGLAQELIDTIRVADATRPLLFGAVNWYRIPELAAGEPFADSNIIYVFHFYEPFLYTHQGAPWEKDLAAVKRIPFPYSPERWGNTYSHFGAQATWVKRLIDNYPDYGNRNAMKALVLQAKEWAVKNNVPVICNEFGANTFQSSHADRIAWLTATVDIFEELQIPWQHWGYDSGNDIVDSQGALLEGINGAFRL